MARGVCDPESVNDPEPADPRGRRPWDRSSPRSAASRLPERGDLCGRRWRARAAAISNIAPTDSSAARGEETQELKPAAQPRGSGAMAGGTAASTARPDREASTRCVVGIPLRASDGGPSSCPQPSEGDQHGGLAPRLGPDAPRHFCNHRASACRCRGAPRLGRCTLGHRQRLPRHPRPYALSCPSHWSKVARLSSASSIVVGEQDAVARLRAVGVSHVGYWLA